MAKDYDLDIINYDDSSLNEQFITAREYEDATKTVVRTLGRDAGTQVSFTGKGAKAGKGKNSKVVVLPANDPSQKMTKRQYFIGQGYANHETLHSVCTDFDGIRNQLKSMKDNKQHLTFSLANAIEDVRIEQAGKALYPGIPSKLDATAEFAARKFLESRDDEELKELASDFKKIGPLAITWAGRKAMGYNAPSLDKCLALLPDDIKKRAEGYAQDSLALTTGVRGYGDLDRAASYQGSHDAIALARKISGEEMKDPKEQEKEKEQQSGGSGDKGEKGEKGDGAGSGGGKPKEGKDEKEGSGKSSGGVGASDPGSQPMPLDPDFLNELTQELVFDTANKYVPLTTSLDVWVKPGDETRIAKHIFDDPDNFITYQQTIDNLTGKLAVMRRKLENALKAKMEREYTSGHRSGKIDVAKKGPDIIRGRENVFRRREEGTDVNAAVTILIDASGSMGGSKIRLAQKACIAMAEAIVQVGVPLEILAFCGRNPMSDEVEGFDELKAIWREGVTLHEAGEEEVSRLDPITMYQVKTFDQSMRQSRQSMGAIGKLAGGNNIDGESLLKAWDRLKVRQEKKKVLMVFSDGQPSANGNQGQIMQHLKDVVKIIGKEGGDCVGLGINSNAVKDYYPRYTVINDIQQLAGITMDNLARLLLGERFVIDNGKLGRAA